MRYSPIPVPAVGRRPSRGVPRAARDRVQNRADVARYKRKTAAAADPPPVPFGPSGLTLGVADVAALARRRAKLEASRAAH